VIFFSQSSNIKSIQNAAQGVQKIVFPLCHQHLTNNFVVCCIIFQNMNNNVFPFLSNNGIRHLRLFHLFWVYHMYLRTLGRNTISFGLFTRKYIIVLLFLSYQPSVIIVHFVFFHSSHCTCKGSAVFFTCFQILDSNLMIGWRFKSKVMP